MDAGAANVIAQGFLKGGFDVLEALLGHPFICDTTETNDLDPEGLGEIMDGHPVGMRSAIAGSGAVAMLFPMKDAAGFLAAMDGEAPGSKEALDDADLPTFKEIGDSVLGGGAATLTEKFSEAVELDGPDSVVATGEHAAELADQLGTATCVRFTFKSEAGFDSEAVLLFSQSLENRVPNDLVDTVFGEGDEASAEPLVSDDEMQDILSGFDPGVDEIGPASPVMGNENLDMILDIELIATVRLGHIEMPIAEVLRLGPGSIIEVGQLVDDPVELLVNGKLVARGDVVVVDEKFGLRVTEIVSRRERIESLR